jgi:hypothetical protein
MKSKSLAVALAVIATAYFGAPMLGLSDASAKSLKCYPSPVAGKPGTYIWLCSNTRI